MKVGTVGDRATVCFSANKHHLDELPRLVGAFYSVAESPGFYTGDGQTTKGCHSCRGVRSREEGF